MKNNRKLFIIGNGFDIAHGIKSKYYDFRKFIVDKFPGLEGLELKHLSPEDFWGKGEYIVKAKVLLDAMDIASNDNWSDFEDALSKLNFDDKYPERTLEAKREDDPQETINYLMMSGMVSECIIDSSEYWQLLFAEWVENLNSQIYFVKKIPGLSKLL